MARYFETQRGRLLVERFLVDTDEAGLFQRFPLLLAAAAGELAKDSKMMREVEKYFFDDAMAEAPNDDDSSVNYDPVAIGEDARRFLHVGQYRKRSVDRPIRFELKTMVEREDLARLREWFDDVEISYNPTRFHDHGILAASLQLETDCCLDDLYRHGADPLSEPLSSREVSVLDIGGNWRWHFYRNHLGVMSLCPMLSERDVGREMQRELVAKPGKEFECGVQYVSWQENTVRAPFAMAIHSAYDIPMDDMVRGMVELGVQRLTGTMHMPEVMMTEGGWDGYRNDEYAYTLQQVFRKSDRREFAVFYMGETSRPYKHDLKTMLGYFRPCVYLIQDNAGSILFKVRYRIDRRHGDLAFFSFSRERVSSRAVERVVPESEFRKDRSYIVKVNRSLYAEQLVNIAGKKMEIEVSRDYYNVIASKFLVEADNPSFSLGQAIQYACDADITVSPSGQVVYNGSTGLDFKDRVDVAVQACLWAIDRNRMIVAGLPTEEKAERIERELGEKGLFRWEGQQLWKRIRRAVGGAASTLFTAFLTENLLSLDSRVEDMLKVVQAVARDMGGFSASVVDPELYVPNLELCDLRSFNVGNCKDAEVADFVDSVGGGDNHDNGDERKGVKLKREKELRFSDSSGMSSSSVLFDQDEIGSIGEKVDDEVGARLTLEEQDLAQTLRLTRTRENLGLLQAREDQAIHLNDGGVESATADQGARNRVSDLIAIQMATENDAAEGFRANLVKYVDVVGGKIRDVHAFNTALNMTEVYSCKGGKLYEEEPRVVMETIRRVSMDVSTLERRRGFVFVDHLVALVQVRGTELVWDQSYPAYDMRMASRKFQDFGLLDAKLKTYSGYLYVSTAVQVRNGTMFVRLAKMFNRLNIDDKRPVRRILHNGVAGSGKTFFAVSTFVKYPIGKVLVVCSLREAAKDALSWIQSFEGYEKVDDTLVTTIDSYLLNKKKRRAYDLVIYDECLVNAYGKRDLLEFFSQCSTLHGLGDRRQNSDSNFSVSRKSRITKAMEWDEEIFDYVTRRNAQDKVGCLRSSTGYGERFSSTSPVTKSVLNFYEIHGLESFKNLGRLIRILADHMREVAAELRESRVVLDASLYSMFTQILFVCFDEAEASMLAKIVGEGKRTVEDDRGNAYYLDFEVMTVGKSQGKTRNVCVLVRPYNYVGPVAAINSQNIVAFTRDKYAFLVCKQRTAMPIDIDRWMDYGGISKSVLNE